MYTQTYGRPLNRYNAPMNDAQINAVAPSVFGAEAHESRSDKYTFIPTIDVVNGLRREGFEVFSAVQSRVKDKANRDFTTHVLKLRHPDTDGVFKDQKEKVEIILRNSHDGNSAFALEQGVYRLVCSNGMVASRTAASLRIPHVGDVLGQIIEGSYRIVENSLELESVIDEWKGLELNQDEQTALAIGAAQLRFGDNFRETINDPAKLLTPKRWTDKGNDLWTSFNRVQENCIKGGVHLGYEKGRRKTSRGITGVDQDLKLNKGLWQLADFLAKVKTGKATAEELLAA